MAEEGYLSAPQMIGLFLAILVAGGDTASPTVTGAVYSGRARQLAVAPPRIDETANIDGSLDEGPWKQAALLTGFSQYAPVDGRAADDSTEVLVWYSPTAIYFGVRAFAAPGTVHATLADRDKMYSDDYIGIFLGTFNDQRQATVFAVNALGVQGDGSVVETMQASGGMTGAAAGLGQGRPVTDITPDFLFESKGRVTPWGYEVEIRIPFKSLKYQSADVQTWGLNVIRIVQSRGHEHSWAPAKRAASSYLGQAGTLTGLTGLHRGIVLDVNPFVTER
ncbi:MAG: carbohydrate binding family 9 domain-containing protein, partial [Gemmatimonadaceae bacterium]